MKKNLPLFGVLLVLLFATWYFQEKRVETASQEQIARDSLVKGELTALKLKGKTLEKRGDRWWSEDRLLSFNQMRLLEQKLRDLRMVKRLEGASLKDHFSEATQFEINGVTYLIGPLGLDKQSFYAARGGEIFLAQVEGESTELTTDETEIPAIKRRELISLLERPLSDLFENQLFRFYPELPFERVVISIDGQLEYELDIKNNTTLPPPLEGITVHEKLKEKFTALITQVTIKEEIPWPEKMRPLGSMTFIAGKTKVTWNLALRGEKGADAVVMDPGKKQAWLMIGGTLRGFFIQVQDYWDKKIIPPEKFTTFDSLSLTFTQGEKAAIVRLVNTEPLKFESARHKIISENMQELITFLFNLGHRDQADRISQLSKSERQQLLTGNHLKVEVLGEEILFWNKAQELIVVNLTRGFKAHFLVPDKSMGFQFQDVLK